MTPRARWLVFLISTPLFLLALIGGVLGMSRVQQGGSYAHLRVFDDVVSLIMSSYVEPVDADKVMEGAMRGLADGLDPESAYLTPDEVALVDAKTPLPAGDVGVVIARQYDLRVLGVREGSPADRAGVRSGDFIRAIDGKSTREVSGLTGTRLLHGAVGSKISLTVIRGNAGEPHVLDLVRDAPTGDPVTARRLPNGEAYLRVAAFTPGAAALLHKLVDAQRQAGAPSAVIDLRGTADGTVDEAIAAAREFVKAGTISMIAGRDNQRTTTTASAGDGAVTLPVVVIISSGTAGPAEVFAAALADNHRADLVGARTAGLAGVQRLVKLPEGRGLWMTYQRYLTPAGEPILEHGVGPTVEVEEPAVGFGEKPPAADDTLTKAIERLKGKKAA